MSGWGSLGYGESESQAQSRTGLRGTAYEGGAASNAFQAGTNYQNLFNQFMTSPFQFAGQTGSQMLPSGKFGLGSNADSAVSEMMTQLHGLSSADMGSRGFLHPENRANVIGSAITRALPTLIPQIQQWQTQQFQAPLSLYAFAGEQARGVGDLWGRLLGAQSDASSSAFNFNVAGGGGKV